VAESADRFNFISAAIAADLDRTAFRRISGKKCCVAEGFLVFSPQIEGLMPREVRVFPWVGAAATSQNSKFNIGFDPGLIPNLRNTQTAYEQ